MSRNKKVFNILVFLALLVGAFFTYEYLRIPDTDVHAVLEGSGRYYQTTKSARCPVGYLMVLSQRKYWCAPGKEYSIVHATYMRTGRDTAGGSGLGKSVRSWWF